MLFNAINAHNTLQATWKEPSTTAVSLNTLRALFRAPATTKMTSMLAERSVGHLIKKITLELTLELTPEITPNYVN